MKITPILPIYPMKNPPRKWRAQMAVNREKHTVYDSETGERFDLPPKEAWEKFNEIQGIVV